MPHVMQIRELTCSQCGNVFVGKDWGGGNQIKTCSKECWRASQSHLWGKRGAAHPTWKGGMLTWTCAQCGVQFQRYRCHRGTDRKYCSVACSNRKGVEDLRTRIRFENKLCEFLAERGYDCARSAGSRGPFDVFAFNQQFARFIQVKSTKAIDRVGNTSVFRDAIERMQTFPDPPGMTKELWVWIIRKGWFYAIVGDAPRDREALVKYVQRIQWIEPV